MELKYENISLIMPRCCHKQWKLIEFWTDLLGSVVAKYPWFGGTCSCSLQYSTVLEIQVTA